MKRNILLIILVYSIIAIITLTLFNGTADDGDSVMHFLFARYAPFHLDLYFNHWAKPLYVLLASPFAQFGFIGVKVFNAINTLVAIIFTYLTARKLGMRMPLLAALFLIVCPGYYILTYSGLTEPLFALVLILSVYLFADKKIVLSLLLISFLPFIRSEGWILMGVFAFYLILKKQFKYLPLLLVGHVVYSVAGYYYYHDILWIFTKNPYGTLKHVYGRGELLHFVDQLRYITGLPLYILFWVGVLYCILQIRNFWQDLFFYILIVGGYFAFFIAHTLFWYLGIFGSMGLNRVLVCIMPLGALIALRGFNLLGGIADKKIRTGIQGAIILVLIIFPFLPQATAVNFSRTMVPTKEQKAANEISEELKDKIDHHAVLSNYPYMLMKLHVDQFGEYGEGHITDDGLSRLKSGDYVIWDDWFADTATGQVKDKLMQDPDYTMYKEIKGEDGKDLIVVFVKK